MKLKNLAALLMTLCVFCIMSGHSAFADYKTIITLTISDSSSGGGDNEGKYIIVIPESLAPTSSGWTAFTGGISIKTAEGSTFSADKKLVISADSANEWKLVLSPDKSASIAYTLNTSSTNKTATTTFEYSAASIDAGVSQDLGVIIADYTGKAAGTYEDTITFHVNIQDAEEAGNVVDLSTVTVYEAQTGDVLTGTAGSEVHITVAKGATITLKDVTITSIPNGEDDDDNPLYPWAGITPLGDATITLKGTNEIKGGHEDYPGIFAAVNSTLTIKGNGSLTAESNGGGAGIGGGRYGINCGNIVIDGGTITATGGMQAAGIGGGGYSSCGDITISGGTITATGGYGSAGIGGGVGAKASCGTITITSGVTSVTATKGGNAPNSIGAGLNGSCGTITIDDESKVTQN